MKRLSLLLLLVFSLLFPLESLEASRGSSSHRSSSHRTSVSSHRSRRSTMARTGRDKRGRIRRSPAAKKEFMRQSGHPHGRPGYVVDHKVPLACGGADDPSNMQWQTNAEAKAKDKWERNGCK